MSSPEPLTGPFNDDDLVYVDPDAKVVVGRVEFDEKGNAKKLERPSFGGDIGEDESDAKINPTSSDSAVASSKDEKPAEPAKPEQKGRGRGRGAPDRRVRKPRTRYYPWGTYRTMKKIYKIEGKVFDAERTLTLDDVMEKALQEPYWD